MSRKLFALALAGLALNLFFVAASVNGKTPEAEAKHVNKVRGQIAKVGAGPQARIEITLRDRTKLKGFIGESDETQFVVVDKQTGARTTLEYPQVQSVNTYHRSGAYKHVLLAGLMVGVVFFSAILSCTVSTPCRAE